MAENSSHEFDTPAALPGRRRVRPSLAPIVLALAIGFALAPALEAQTLALGDLRAIPPQAAPADQQALHWLSVDVTNNTETTASRLRFAVEVNGAEVTLYRRRVYLLTIPPQQTRTVRLYNFWAPAGDLRVSVSLIDARTVVDEGGDVPTWRETGAVDGLPVEITLP